MNRLILLALSLTMIGAVQAEPPAQDSRKEALGKFLAEKKVTGVALEDMQELTDVALAKIFPTNRFYLLRFPIYPVARLAPEQLKTVNIFAVSQDGKVKLIVSTDELFDLFKSDAEKAAPVHIITAWGLLAKEFSEDGFYRLKLRVDWIKPVEKQGDNKVVAVDAVITGVRSGDGQIKFYLTLDPQNRPIAHRSESSLKPGVRPICQSMQLNDSDPVMRFEAEEALLWMGQSALPYLCERAAAAPPPLREKIQAVIDKILTQPDAE